MKGSNNPMYGRKGEYASNSRKIVQLELDGSLVRKWNCISDVVRELGFNCGSISRCCRGKLKKHKGYKWMYYEDYIKQGEINDENI